MLTPSGRFQPDRRICFSMSDFHPGSWNPAWSVATILTGLLSFMLSDEMTTGSVTSSDAHKRVFAQRSHGWNILQPRFKEAFPDYCTPEPRAVPNMGERSLGKPDPTPTAASTKSLSTSTIPSPSPFSAQTPAPVTSSLNKKPSPVQGHGDNLIPKPPAPGTGWTTAWRQCIWEKWRWGVLIALAVVVSRLSSGG